MDESRNLRYMEELIEIEPLDRRDFLRVRETLTRMGILSVSTGTLWQSCHLLHKRQRYFIVHFKQMFVLDGKLDPDDIGDEDLDRVEKVACMLVDWGLVKAKTELDRGAQAALNIVPKREVSKYKLKSKYTIGNNTNHERSENAPGNRPGHD